MRTTRIERSTTIPTRGSKLSPERSWRLFLTEEGNSCDGSGRRGELHIGDDAYLLQCSSVRPPRFQLDDIPPAPQGVLRLKQPPIPMPQHPNTADSSQASPSDHHCQREGRSSQAEVDSMMQNAESSVLKVSPTRPRLRPGTV